ncbi:MAG: formate dehydrogenase accessory protein FdhE [Desulfovibrionales bacterium]
MGTNGAMDISRVNRKLKALKRCEHIPADLLDLIDTVLNKQLEVQDDAVLSELPGDRAVSTDELRRGKPLVGREGFPVDREQAKVLFEEFAQSIAGMPPMDTAVTRIREAIGTGELDLDKAFDAYIEGDDSFFSTFGEKTPGAPRCLNFLVQSSLSPSLRKAAQGLGSRLPEDLAWSHGSCPLCGSPPLIGRLHGKEGDRMLTCSFCAFEYRGQRLTCPFCLEQNPRKLEYFDAKEDPGIMVEVCTSCNHYIKTLDYRSLDRICIPVLDDLLSLPFDIVAGKQGYLRPTLSAWGF